ncbi:MAG: sigma 54-interacting transcriptional regulator [Polaromonas sp.]|nr:sigma 54-interacting transcriptional regulator [Polaromonas sp.]
MTSPSSFSNLPSASSVSERVWSFLAQQFEAHGLEVCVMWAGASPMTWVLTGPDGQQRELVLEGAVDTVPADAAEPGGFHLASVPARLQGVPVLLTGVSIPASGQPPVMVLGHAPALQAGQLVPVFVRMARLGQIAQESDGRVDAQAHQLREQQAIVDHISDGLLVVDREGVVKHLNAAAGRILSLVPAQSVGRKFSELLDFEPIIAPILASGVGYQDRELIIDSPQRHLHLIDTAVPIKDRSGRVVSIVNSFREIQRVRKVADRFNGSHARYTFDNLIGNSQALVRAIDAAQKAARGFANVMLTGESGVGKEVFAQAIHNASERADGPFIAINCAALPRELIESELFGYASGSFTGARKEGRPGKFEAASGGTIFLDEISELPIDVQAKLLRVLQEREVVRLGETRGIPIDVRLMSASNRDLRAMSRVREFREDLYYRCHVIGINIPALRDRPSDIPVLANLFVARYAGVLKKDVFGFSPAALERLCSYNWPGNVRELENAVERIVNLTEHELIEISDLPDELQDWRMPATQAGSAVKTLPRSLHEVEREAILVMLTHCAFNVTEAARRLGISKPTLYSKVREHGITLERGARPE